MLKTISNKINNTKILSREAQSINLLFKAITLIFAFLFTTNSSFSQFGFDKLEHNFGNVLAGNNRFVDLKFKNTTNEKIYLLNIRHDRTVKTLINSTTIKPDSTLIIRIKYNPTKKGKFKVEIPVYLSNSFEPFIFTIKGNIKEVDNSMGLDCPSFGSQVPKQRLNFKFTATILDKKTNQPIHNAGITFINRGTVTNIEKTNRRGIVKTTIPIGLYYFVIDAEGYIGTEFPKYINRQNDSILVYLDKPELVVINNKPITIEEEEPILVEEEEEEPIIVVINEKPKDSLPKTVRKEEPIPILKRDSIPKIIELKKDFPVQIVKIPDTIPEPKEDLTDFPELKYKPNNLVFLLDISSSMKKEGKLDLLKASMIEMVNVLRGVDKITIITYSTFAKVVLKTTTGNNKEQIIEIIQNIKGEGMTAGVSGMKLAYRHAKKNFIEDGNNQIIMATDGNFNRGNTKIDRLVTKNREKGILISVMGIKNKPEHANDMREISSLGGGTYLFIDNYKVSKEILIREIKRNSTK
jgi:Ca-activated chloride channel family protein